MIDNKLLNTIGCMDERHIRENEINEFIKLGKMGTIEKSKPKKFRILIVAAAAAVLSLLVGFTTAEIVKNTIIVEGVGQVKFDLYKQDITIVPKEELPQEKYTGSINMPTEELFAKFGVEPIMTDNFSYDVTPTKQWYSGDDEGNAVPVNICLPLVFYGEGYVTIDYCLYDKARDINIRMSAVFQTADDLDVGWIIEQEKLYGDHELIKLNDGSDCHLSRAYGIRFAHDGVYYFIIGDENYREFDIETQKQIMRDFGLL